MDDIGRFGDDAGKRTDDVAGVGSRASRGSSLPVPERTQVTTNSGETLYYQSHTKHTPGQHGYNPSAGTEPKNSLDLFGNSVTFGDNKTRYAVDSDGNVHRFNGSNGTYHWNGSTGDKSSPLNINATSAKHNIRDLKRMGAKI